jgi:hypothetical protein
LWHISLARQPSLRWEQYISNINANRPRTAALIFPSTEISKQFDPVIALVETKQWQTYFDYWCNWNTSNGTLHSALTGPGLLMREGVWTLHLNLPTISIFMAGSHLGSVPIDAGYLSPDLLLHASSWIVVKWSPGDHHSCILEIWWKTMVGEDLFKIARPETHCPSTAAYQSVTKYNELFEAQCSWHKVPPKLYAIHQTYEGSLTWAQQGTMEAINRVKTEAILQVTMHGRAWLLSRWQKG